MVRVFNVRGMVVRHLADRSVGMGQQVIPWDGRDDIGRKVSTGLYLVVLKAGQTTDIKKVLVIQR